jgi:PAS domain S-box-containing protein
MSWTTIVWSLDAAACLTLMSVHIAIGLRLRRTPDFLFALNAASTAAIAFGGLWMMRATTTVGYGQAVRWVHVPIWTLVIGMILFVRSRYGAGNPTIAWVAIGLRSAALVVNFLRHPNLNYEAITGLRTVEVWGDPVVVAEGIRSAWSFLGEASAAALALFLLTAVRDVWRRGERREAVVVLGSMFFVAVAAAVHTTLVHLGVIRWPYVISLLYLVVVAAMYSELTRDALSGAELSERLKRVEQRTALADEAAGVGQWTFEILTRELWMSETARRLFAYPLDRPLDQEVLWSRIHADDRERMRQTFERSLREGGGFEREYRLVLPDGQTRWITSRGRTIAGPDGRPVRAQGVWMDATRRRDAEREAESQRNELAHLARVSVLGELSGSLAHELNQPLTAIVANAQAAELLLSRDGQDPAEIREILGDIVDQGLAASEVIRRLRLLLTKGEVHLQNLQLAEVIEDVLRLVHSELVHRGVTVERDGSQPIPPVMADRIQIQQVLLNLIQNGCDAMDTVERSRRALLVHTGMDGGGCVRISVSDRGTGIPEDYLPKMFNPFSTTKPTGMGLGLAVCRTIIEAHGGRISAENDPAGGATISFTLPAATSSAST